MTHLKKNKLEKLRGIFFQIGLLIAGGLTLLAFEWTTPVYSYDLPTPDEIYEEEWELPAIIPEKEVEKPEVKHKENIKINKEIIEIVKHISDPDPTPNPTPDPDPVFTPDPEPEPIPEPDAPFIIVEKMPEFIGGMKKMKQFLGANLKYPKLDKEAGIEGTVYVQFVVNKKGEIKNVEILRGVSPTIDKEALRVVKNMPNWSPGKQRGKTVSVLYNLPLTFTLK